MLYRKHTLFQNMKFLIYRMCYVNYKLQRASLVNLDLCEPLAQPKPQIKLFTVMKLTNAKYSALHLQQ